MSALFSSPKKPEVPDTSQVDEDAERAAIAQRKRRRGARGRASTVLSSGLGVQGRATTAKTKLGQ